jgi:hypothetical protein
MSRNTTLILNLGLFAKTPSQLQLAFESLNTTSCSIEPEKMNNADWDRVLQLILDHERCLTL